MSLNQSPKHALILPAYNETVAIAELISDLLKTIASPTYLVIVDDSANSISSKYVKSEFEKNKNSNFRVHYINNAHKSGRGSAVRQGIMWVLNNTNCDWIVEADSDGSHPSDMIKKVLDMRDSCEFVIGSRYMTESQITGWPMSRRLFSKVLNTLIPKIFNLNIYDWTNGLRGYSRSSSEVLIKYNQICAGFTYLSEQILVLDKNGIRPVEIPIHFINRIHGSSSVGATEISRSMVGLYKLWKKFGYK